jgi:hypothetical protein
MSGDHAHPAAAGIQGMVQICRNDGCKSADRFWVGRMTQPLDRNPLRAACAVDQDGRDHHAQRGLFAAADLRLLRLPVRRISALASIAVVTGACLLTERFFVRTGTQAGRLSDYSAVITGLLLALTLPPGFPLWMGAVAGMVAIALGKALFGGIGFNVFNPALVGRAFVQAAFPTAIATYTPSFLPGRFTEFIPVDPGLAADDPDRPCGLAQSQEPRRAGRGDAAGEVEVRRRHRQCRRAADLAFRPHGGGAVAAC